MQFILTVVQRSSRYFANIVVISAAEGKLFSVTSSIKLSSLLQMEEVFSATGVGNFHQSRLQLSSIACYQPPGDHEASRSRRQVLMIKLGCKGTLLVRGVRL